MSTVIINNKFIFSQDPTQYIVQSGGNVVVEFGGSALNPIVDYQGRLLVETNSSVTGAEIDTGGSLVFAAGTATNTVINGGDMNVSSGATANGVVINSGTLELGSGSISSGIVVDGGTATVQSNAAAQGVILKEGTLQLNPNSKSSGNTISGGTEIISGSASDSGSTLIGGLMVVGSGGAASSETVNGGTLLIGNNGTGSNNTVNVGGTEDVFGVEAKATIAGGSLIVEAGASFNNVTFNDTSLVTGKGGTLDIRGTASPAGTVSNFGPSDVIEFQDIAYDPKGTATLGSNDVLTVTENGQSINLQLDPSQNYKGDYFSVSKDNKTGGTIVSLTQASSNPKEKVLLSSSEGVFAHQVSNNISAFDANPFAHMVSLIQNTPQAYLNAVRTEAHDPLLRAALADTATGATKTSEIANAALQLASSIHNLGVSNSLQTAAAITAGAIHELQTGNIGLPFVNNQLQNKAASILTAENHIRPF